MPITVGKSKNTHKNRDLKPLAAISAFGIVAILATFLLVYAAAGVNSTSNNNQSSGLTFYTTFNEFGYGVGAIFTSFSSHTVIPNLKSSMRNPNEFRDVINVVWLIISCALTSVGSVC